MARLHLILGSIVDGGLCVFQVANLKMTAALAKVTRQVNSLSKKSDWDSLLSMKMPKTDCPNAYTQLVGL